MGFLSNRKHQETFDMGLANGQEYGVRENGREQDVAGLALRVAEGTLSAKPPHLPETLDVQMYVAGFVEGYKKRR